MYAERKTPPPSAAPKRPTRFAKRDGHYEVRLRLPFAAKGEVGLFKKGDELVVEIGTLRRHIGLPTSMAALTPGRAKLENRDTDRGNEGDLNMEEKKTAGRPSRPSRRLLLLQRHCR